MPQAVQLQKLVLLPQAIKLLGDRAHSAEDRRMLLVAACRSRVIRYASIVWEVTVRIRPSELSCSFRHVGEAYELPPHIWDGKVAWSNSWLFHDPPPPVEGGFWITRGYEIFVLREDVLLLRQELGTARPPTGPHKHQSISSETKRRGRGRPRKISVDEALDPIARVAAESPWIHKLAVLVNVVRRQLRKDDAHVSKRTIRRRMREAMEILRACGDPYALNFGPLY
jgi:hypothetical protein